MPHYIYSSETLPNPAFFGKPHYNPEWFIWNGIQLPVLTKGEWAKLPDSFTSIRHADWKDKAGKREVIATEDIKKAVEARWGASAGENNRGVIVLDHEPTDAEKKEIAARSLQANQAFRMLAVERYENEVREREVTGKGRSWPTPYENECYEILGLTKPYSVEAKRAQRHPGEAVGEQIVAALERLEQRRREQDEKAVGTPIGPNVPRVPTQEHAQAR